MHISTTGKIIFTSDNEILDQIADYCDQEQIGETFYDDSIEKLTLILDEECIQDGREDVLSLIEQLSSSFDVENILAKGTMTDLETENVKQFECQYNQRKNYLRYRETEWISEHFVDSSLSYEEFEEENGVELDEDEYEEHLTRAKKGVFDRQDDSFGTWEYIDKD